MGSLVENQEKGLHPAISVKWDALKNPKLSQFILGTVSLLLCLLLWQALAQFKINLGIVNFSNVPTPVEVVQAIIQFFQLPTALAHLKASMLRVLIGFALAGVIGVALGLLIGQYKKMATFFLTPLEVLRPIPAVAWIPLAILIFPSSEASMIYITFIGALFPILLNTIHGVEAVDPRLIASAKSLGASEFAIVREVVIPGALPNITTGLSIGMGTCWFCLVTAEMISGQLGIGYFTWESFTLQNYSSIVVGMLLIGALGMMSSALVRWIGKKFTPWYQLRKA
ncbi:ABC transporter permease [Acinetobacter sp. YH12045]|uniref:ABC transporter permease n=1 Tax=Acinetobacter sp. YH12045 TaxID=2601051 RepID=UPI0015D3D00C|nr:ABC transporter permease [Acinetobacter sp. YH12045]